MRVVSANVNGIRAARRRGGVDWLAGAGADVLCLQEVRADADALRVALGDEFADWDVVDVASGVRPGHSGVAVVSREPLEEVPGPISDEGRWVSARTGGLTVASVYVHTGEADSPQQQDKEAFLAQVGQWMHGRTRSLLCGDINVAHTEMDIKNWKGNIGKAGFLESERAILSSWFADWVDLGRRFGGPGPGPYTWWSWRGKAFDNDAGWRIDYAVASPDLAQRVRSVTVVKAASYGQRWSDHAPLVVDIA